MTHIDKVIEAIGWAYADCCTTLDKGGDPRQTDMADVIERATKDLELDGNTTSWAVNVLKAAIHSDDDLAWSWHCNLAMAAQDEGLDHESAQRAARRFMGWAFDRSDYPTP